MPSKSCWYTMSDGLSYIEVDGIAMKGWGEAGRRKNGGRRK